MVNIAILSACNTTASMEIAEGILEEQQMVEIIADMHVLDAAQRAIPISGSKQVAMKDTTYAIIYAHHGTNHTEFDSSLREYARHPELMGEIMERVAEKINSTK